MAGISGEDAGEDAGDGATPCNCLSAERDQTNLRCG